MMRLVADEMRKLKRTWVLAVLPVLSLLAPLLGVLTVRDNAARNPDKIFFDLPTIFAQVQLDNSLLVAPLFLGSLGIFLLQREYQESTLGPLLCVPIRRSDLITAKVILTALAGLAGSFLSAVLTLPLAWSAGLDGLDGNPVVEGTARLMAGELLTLPCVLLLMAVVVVFRNYLVAMSLAFASLVLGMVAVTLPEISCFVPWLSPTILSVSPKTVETLGLTPPEVVKSAASFLIFTGAVTTLLYWTFGDLRGESRSG